MKHWRHEAVERPARSPGPTPSFRTTRFVPRARRPSIEDGAFVAEVPGRYTVLAMSRARSSRALPFSMHVSGKPCRRSSSRGVDRSPTRTRRTSGSSRASTDATTPSPGTWAANGWAFFWDVTDPTNINEGRLDPGRRAHGQRREGLARRTIRRALQRGSLESPRNGVVILDMADPANPVIASTFDSNGVTGGVHNMFATERLPLRPRRRATNT